MDEDLSSRSMVAERALDYEDRATEVIPIADCALEVPLPNSFRGEERANEDERRAGGIVLLSALYEESRTWSRRREDVSALWAAFETIPQGVCMFGADRRLILSNRRYAQMYGLERIDVSRGTLIEDVLRRRVRSGMVVTAGYVGQVLEEIRKGRATTKFTELIDGRTIAVEYRPLPDGGWVATHEDISDRIEMKARLAAAARRDPLTGLCNRTKLIEELRDRQGTSDDQSVFLLQIDLDNFRHVNELLGRVGGDTVLHQIGQRLLACAHGGDVVSRTDSDRFAIACFAADIGEIEALAEKVLRSISAPFAIQDHEVFTSASIGIAQMPAGNRDIDALMRQADLALVPAKERRKAYRFFYAEMHDEAHSRRRLQRDLHKALLRGELEVHYQPIFGLQTKQVTTFEALLRWNHPALGSVTPAQFIPLAEASGLMGVIGEWTLRQACATCATWPTHIRVAVNLSATQLRAQNFSHVVRKALEAAQIAADRLELEITETAVKQDDRETMQTLRDLRALGVRIVMDDFGIGYSALSFLHRFPFDKVKIDGCFLQNHGDTQFPERMLEAIAALVRTLQITTTVEGVETPDQLAKIRGLGCHEVQGFICGRPMPTREVAAALASRSDWRLVVN